MPKVTYGYVVFKNIFVFGGPAHEGWVNPQQAVCLIDLNLKDLEKIYLSVKKCLKRSKTSHFIIIKLNSKELNDWYKLFETLKSIIFVPNKPDSERFWKKYFFVENCLKRSKASYLSLINLILKDFEKNIFFVEKHHSCV